MKIGIPRERKEQEKRVAITPDGARKLITNGHTVQIEKSAGEGAGFTDSEYQASGAVLLDTLEEVWTTSDMVVKVKEPHEEEYQYFRPGLILFDYLHLASMPDVAKVLLDKGVTGVAYELVIDEEGRLPLLEPMSEIAGKLSVINGSNYLLSQNQGRGLLLGGAVGVPRANVTIIGAGVSGRAACEIAYGMGANVRVFDLNLKKLASIATEFGQQISTAYSTSGALERAVANTDLLIGAVLIPGAAAPKIVTKSMIKSMPKGSVFVDISIDQGGCGETIRPTSLNEPVYLQDEVLHYGVCNMPAQTARTSTMALTNSTLPYVLRLASGAKDGDMLASLKNDKELRGALNTHEGKLTNREVSVAVGVDYTPIDEALPV